MNCPECNVSMERTEKYRCPDCGAEFDRSDDWISVKVRLPKVDGDYLVYGKNEHGTIINDCDWFDTRSKDWWKYPHGQITHWQYRPEPPKEDE